MPALSFLRRRPTACALLSAVLLAASFPPLHLSLLAWVALAPLLVVTIERRARWRQFAYGWLAGALFFAGTCYWIFAVMRLHGGLSGLAAGAVLALFALAAGLYVGLFSLGLGELARRWQMGALLFAPFLWVALEWLRGHFPVGGFPWNLLGYALAPHLGWIQPAAVTGVYGVSFLVVGVNALVAACWEAPSRRRLGLLAGVAVLLGVVWVVDFCPPPLAAESRALLIQTNLPQPAEFDPEWLANNPEAFDELERLTREAVRQYPSAEPGLIVWPEIPVSLYFHRDPVVRARLIQLAQATQSYFLVGVVDFRKGAEGRLHPTNSAVLLSPGGELIGQYDKIHLVPFGEYVPLGSWLRFLGPLTEEVSDFVPGREANVLPADVGRVGTLICYEAVFPELARNAAGEGAEVLVNISNDGWFGRSAAAAQHLNMARVRAVETRRFLLRATNTGLTAVVDPYGRMAQAPAHTRTVFVAGFAARRERSPYVRFGDWLAALCGIVSVATLARKLWITAVEREA